MDIWGRCPCPLCGLLPHQLCVLRTHQGMQGSPQTMGWTPIVSRQLAPKDGVMQAQKIGPYIILSWIRTEYISYISRFRSIYIYLYILLRYNIYIYIYIYYMFPKSTAARTNPSNSQNIALQSTHRHMHSCHIHFTCMPSCFRCAGQSWSWRNRLRWHGWKWRHRRVACLRICDDSDSTHTWIMNWYWCNINIFTS